MPGDENKGRVDAGQVPPERQAPQKNEELDDVSADGGGQKTSVGEPYEGGHANRGVEKEQHRDVKSDPDE